MLIHKLKTQDQYAFNRNQRKAKDEGSVGRKSLLTCAPIFYERLRCTGLGAAIIASQGFPIFVEI